jgi:phosphatidate cytidylyltransferase
MTDPAPKPVRFGDLGLRTISGVALAAVSLLCVWIGGALAALYVAAALALLLWEYHALLSGDAGGVTPPLVSMLAGGAAAVLATALGAPAIGFVCLLAGTLVAAVLAGRRFEWLVGGALYVGIALCGLLVVRDQPGGFALILWLVVVVIAADVGAYFVGRRIGGPKLWPRVSPGKTRSGAIGGLVCAAVVGLAVALLLGWPAFRALWLAIAVAVGSQLGDLLESAVKRRAGVKDSGKLLPGHGGLLDRFDGILGGTWVFLILHALGIGLSGH